MMTLMTRTQTEGIVRRHVANQEMFTAFDVTQELRSLNAGDRIFHEDVKDAVHAMYHAQQMGADYTRSLRKVAKSGESALVYHHTLQDAANYGATVVGTLPATLAPLSITAQSPTAIAAPKASTRQSDITSRDLDRWGRVRVPSAAMRAAGFLPGDQAFVTTDPATDETNLFFNEADAVATGLNVRQYAVDCYCNVRMKLASPGALQQYGVETGHKVVTIAPKVQQQQNMTNYLSSPAFTGALAAA